MEKSAPSKREVANLSIFIAQAAREANATALLAYARRLKQSGWASWRQLVRQQLSIDVQKGLTLTSEGPQFSLTRTRFRAAQLRRNRTSRYRPSPTRKLGCVILAELSPSDLINGLPQPSSGTGTSAGLVGTRKSN